MRNAMIGVRYALLALVLAGCGNNPYEESAEAKAEVDEEKAKILEDYRECLKENPSDTKACEAYKDAVNSL